MLARSLIQQVFSGQCVLVGPKLSTHINCSICWPVFTCLMWLIYPQEIKVWNLHPQTLFTSNSKIMYLASWWFTMYIICLGYFTMQNMISPLLILGVKAVHFSFWIYSSHANTKWSPCIHIKLCWTDIFQVIAQFTLGWTRKPFRGLVTCLHGFSNLRASWLMLQFGRWPNGH